jgi:ribosome-associated toxin RatA of RatAB toxin-antitoxin module
VLEAAPDSVRATLEMRRAGISVSLTTQNTLRPGEHIGLALADGPFRVFEGRWDFVAIRAPGEGGLPGPVRGCRVELWVSFEFRNAAVGLLAGPLFESTWDTLVDAFVRRAREVYGRGR